MKINYKSFYLKFPTKFFSAGKYITVFFLMSSFFFSCKPNTAKISDEEKMRELIFTNKVKSITEFTKHVHGVIEENEFISKITYFDRNGLKRKEIAYEPDSSVVSTTTFDYDKNNNLILINGMNADGTSYREAISYDKNGNRSELVHYLNNGTFKFKKSFIYDNDGKEIEVDWYTPDKQIAKVIYIYDSENKIKEIEYSPTGKLVYTWNNKYDANNNLIEAVQSKPDKTILKKITNVFDKNNHLIKKISYSGEELENSRTFEYDKNNFLISQSDFNRFGQITFQNKFQLEYFQ